MAELLSPDLNLGTDLFFCLRLLHLQDGLLPEKDNQLPLARHVVGIFQMLCFIENTIVVVLMRSEKVIISDPEGDIVAGTLIVVISACYTEEALNVRLRRSIICLKGRNSLETSSSFVSPMT